MKHFFIITNSYKDKNLMLTKSMKDYIETRGGECGYYVSSGEENDSACVCPKMLPEKPELIFVIGGDGTLIHAARDTAESSSGGNMERPRNCACTDCGR